MDDLIGWPLGISRMGDDEGPREDELGRLAVSVFDVVDYERNYGERVCENVGLQY